MGLINGRFCVVRVEQNTKIHIILASCEVHFVEVLEVRVYLAGFFLVVGILFLSFVVLYENILTFVIAKLRIVMI